MDDADDYPLIEPNDAFSPSSVSPQSVDIRFQTVVPYMSLHHIRRAVETTGDLSKIGIKHMTDRVEPLLSYMIGHPKGESLEDFRNNIITAIKEGDQAIGDIGYEDDSLTFMSKKPFLFLVQPDLQSSPFIQTQKDRSGFLDLPKRMSIEGKNNVRLLLNVGSNGMFMADQSTIPADGTVVIGHASLRLRKNGEAGKLNITVKDIELTFDAAGRDIKHSLHQMMAAPQSRQQKQGLSSRLHQ